MKTKKSFKADLENRRTTFALIGLVLALGFTYICFEWGKSNATVNNDIIDPFDREDIQDIDIPKTWQEEPKQQTAPIAKAITFKIPKPVDDDVPTDPNIDIPSDDTPDLPLAPIDTTDDLDTPDPIIDFVQKAASFPGGEAELMKFLGKELQYPQIAVENRIQGRVYIQFVVNKDGTIQDITLAKSVDKSIDQEALRVVKKMPKWIPAQQNNATCRSRYILPILFRLK